MAGHSLEKMQDALKRLVTRAFNQTPLAEQPSCFSIPANFERDADLILNIVIGELMAARVVIAAIGEEECGDSSNPHNGDTPDPHCEVCMALAAYFKMRDKRTVG